MTDLPDFTSFTTEKGLPTGDFREKVELKPSFVDHWFIFANVVKFMTQDFDWEWVIYIDQNRVVVFRVGSNFGVIR